MRPPSCDIIYIIYAHEVSITFEHRKTLWWDLLLDGKVKKINRRHIQLSLHKSGNVVETLEVQLCLSLVQVQHVQTVTHKMSADRFSVYLSHLSVAGKDPSLIITLKNKMQYQMTVFMIPGKCTSLPWAINYLMIPQKVGQSWFENLWHAVH